LFYTALGLCGEAGEAAEVIKKLFRNDDGTGTVELSSDRKAKLAFELGDVLWYVANLAREAGLNLDEIAELNVLKLTARQQADKLKGDGDFR
jgi:NTP pyrophosphatase (non-canonical NTP hydrolase)